MEGFNGLKVEAAMEMFTTPSYQRRRRFYALGADGIVQEIPYSNVAFYELCPDEMELHKYEFLHLKF